jgi:hypothetical protein
MTHKELVEKAARWLKNGLHCRVVLTEYVCNNHCLETPDAIGWVGGKSILVECKTSVADFRADGKKFSRGKYGNGFGDWRFYLTPPGLLHGEIIPHGWGVYEARANKTLHFIGAKYKNALKPPFQACLRSERMMLVSALAKEQTKKGGE